MNRDFLEKQGLEKEVIDAVMAEHGKSVHATKQELESVTTDRDNLKQQIADRDTQLSDLKKEVKDNEELTARITELETANEQTETEYREKLEEQQRDFAIETALRDAKAINPKRAKKALSDEFESVIFKDGKLIGLDEVMTTIKESEAYLFEVEKEPENITPKGAQPGTQRKVDPNESVDLSKMTYKEQVDFKMKHPEKYQELTQK